MWWPILPVFMIASSQELPAGTAPAALSFPHFPDRLHAFVWRNWQLVPVERMAATVGARREDIVRIGRTMGLAGPPRITRDQVKRSYVTVIRRNWHLLPYDQLLRLLDWSPEKLAYILREDDFLFVKLGNLKPRCEPLRYASPTPETTEKARQIARIVRAHFPSDFGQLPTPLFDFVRELRRPLQWSVQTKPSPDITPRFCYSYFGLYGDPLSDPSLDPYPDGYLARLSEAGVDGVWIHAVLYKLASFPWEPSLSEGYEARLSQLRRLVSRAKRHGVRVFLYLNEPRSMPLAFFQTRPHLLGVKEGDYATLCTSVPEVQAYLRNAVTHICQAVPDLGGFFTITMSENLTNCWSHGQGAQCPRCGPRHGTKVIAEVNRVIHEGIQRAGGSQQLIVWDWGWPDDWAEAAIEALPPEVKLMSVSEWSLPIERGGVSTTVGEYSISAVGPGPRALRHWSLARRRGMHTLAKVQAGATWELASVPYVPAVELVAQHAENLRAAEISGVMLGWTLGGYPSPSLEVFGRVLAGQPPDEALDAVARRRYGETLARAVVQAWREASAAFAEFPFHIGTVYTGPQHAGPSNLLWLKPTGYRATMVGFPYDDLDAWRSVYPPEVFVQQMRAAATGFLSGADRLERLVPGAGHYQKPLAREAGLLRASGLHLASSADQAEFVMIRNRLHSATADQARSYRARLRDILRAEMARAKKLYELQVKDPRIGFEATNHYFYVPMDLGEKVLNCVNLLEQLGDD